MEIGSQIVARSQYPVNRLCLGSVWTQCSMTWTFLNRSPKKVSTYRVCDPVQCAEEITRRGREWRVNLNPATLVTPTVQCPILIYLMTTNQHIVSRTERTTKDTQGREE